MLPHPTGPETAMSALPSPSKSPVTSLAPGVAAQAGKLATPLLVTKKLPSPRENATGIEPQPVGPETARSVRPSPLKSPDTSLAPGVAAQIGKLATPLLVTVKPPSPRENATGIEPQPVGPERA